MLLAISATGCDRRVANAELQSVPATHLKLLGTWTCWEPDAVSIGQSRSATKVDGDQIFAPPHRSGERLMSDWNQQIIEEFRANDGTVETMGFGRGLVLLHHVGAKSGTERITPLAAIPTDDGAWLIAASKAGAPDNPDWYHNVLAHPEISLEAPGEGSVEVRARVLEGAERDAAWAQFEAASEGFRSYQEKTTRVIPVVELRRR